MFTIGDTQRRPDSDLGDSRAVCSILPAVAVVSLEGEPATYDQCVHRPVGRSVCSHGSGDW